MQTKQPKAWTLTISGGQTINPTHQGEKRYPNLLILEKNHLFRYLGLEFVLMLAEIIMDSFNPHFGLYMTCRCIQPVMLKMYRGIRVRSNLGMYK